MSWPPDNPRPTEKRRFWCDGGYGRDLFRISPEGLAYGQRVRYQYVPHYVWWDGVSYRFVEETGVALELAGLPTDLRPFGEIWGVRRFDQKIGEYVFDQYYASSGEWKPIRWFRQVPAFSKLPRPGLQVGAAHVVLEVDVPLYWDGNELKRDVHSGLYNDEPERHLPPGFIESLVADVQLTFVTNKQLALMPVVGGSGQVWVRSEWITAGPDTAVYSHLASLEWDSQNKVLVPALLEPDTEYYVYQANTKDTAFVIEGIEGDATHNAAPAWNYRGRLFLSRSAPQGQYLSRIGSGRHARLAGKIQTDKKPAAEGGPFFLGELNISKISNRSSLPEAMREHSDFVLQFTDQDTLTLAQIDGTYGEIAIASKLYYLLSDCEVVRSDGSIEWDDSVDGKLVRRTFPPLSNAQYYVYMAGNIDAFNRNDINPDTSRPWDDEDEGSEAHYDPDKDFRVRPFLSLKYPDHGRMSEQHPGFYTRHIGQVATDGTGRFINAADISAIRQPTLNPTRFDGLAEISFVEVNDTEFCVIKRAGSSGIITVAGEGVRTYELADSQVHSVKTTDTVQLYTEGNLSAPLSDLDALSGYPETPVYVYMANSRPLWGSYASRVFLSFTPPVNGYLSRNWPGNQARWVATVALDASSKFSATFLSNSVTIQQTNINDNAISTSQVWSSSKIQEELAKLYTLIADQGTIFDNQKVTGLALILEMYDATHLRLRPVSNEDTSVVFPDVSAMTVPGAGMLVDVSGTTDVMYYVYLSRNDGVFLSTDAPEITYSKLAILGNSILLGYMACSAENLVSGAWNVFSFWNQPEQTWWVDIGWDASDPYYENPIREVTINIDVPGLVIPPGVEAHVDDELCWAQAWYDDPNTGNKGLDLKHAGLGEGTNPATQYWIDTTCSALGEYGHYPKTLDAGIYWPDDLDLTTKVWPASANCGIYTRFNNWKVVRSGN